MVYQASATHLCHFPCKHNSRKTPVELPPGFEVYICCVGGCDRSCSKLQLNTANLFEMNKNAMIRLATRPITRIESGRRLLSRYRISLRILPHCCAAECRSIAARLETSLIPTKPMQQINTADLGKPNVRFENHRSLLGIGVKENECPPITASGKQKNEPALAISSEKFLSRLAFWEQPDSPLPDSPEV